MNIGQAIKMALKSILGKKARSILTMLGIIIGIASVMIIVSTINGQNQETLKQFEAMGTNRIELSVYLYNGKDPFEDLYAYCLQISDYVDGVTPNSTMDSSVAVVYGLKSSKAMNKNQQNYWNSDGGDAPSELPPDLYLGSDQFSICNNFQVERGRDLSYLDVKNYSQVCVLGARAAKTFFGYSDPIGKVMSVNSLPFTVVGVYQEKDPDTNYGSQDNVIVFPYTVRRIISPNTQISDFIVKAKSAQDAVEATSRISAYLTGLVGQNNERGWGYVQDSNQWQQSSTEWATQMSIILGGIAAISLLVGGIGIMNIMLVTVTERTREIGIRRAIGAERGSIVTQFLIEAAMLCGIGGIIGIGIGTIGTRIAGRLLLQMSIWPSLGITLGAFTLSVILGVLFGIYPAAKAASLQPVEALRAE